MYSLIIDATFESWRDAARRALLAGCRPNEVQWQVQRPGESYQKTLFAPTDELPEPQPGAKMPRVSRTFMEWAEAASYHSDVTRFDLLYRILWRLTHENPRLMDVSIDEDVRSIRSLEHQVRRDSHKMKAFVRFKKVGVNLYVAWHEPDHPILRRVAPFFMDRFAVMNWVILTPDESVAWDGEKLSWGKGCPQSAAPQKDDLEELWKTYYGSIFNPARVKVRAMKSEMAVRYWKSLPETSLIDELLENAESRVEAMIEATPRSAAPYLPEEVNLSSIREALKHCRACTLCEEATQPVAGEGPENARVVLIGEQPGDQEDLAGRPFVGPAGQLLDQALEDAGWPRSSVYVTNAVKHFKFKWNGKRRIHEKPSPKEVAACKPWLAAEIRTIKPDLVICLGLSAALATFGQSLRLGDVRGKILRSGAAERTMVTVHPSHILRLGEGPEGQEAYQRFVEDLRYALEIYRNFLIENQGQTEGPNP